MFIGQYRDRFGFEPICRILQLAPSTYWSQERRPPSARSQRDEELKTEITRVWRENFGVYGTQGLGSVEQGGDQGGPLHGGTTDAEPGIAGCGERKDEADHDPSR